MLHFLPEKNKTAAVSTDRKAERLLSPRQIMEYHIDRYTQQIGDRVYDRGDGWHYQSLL